MIPARNSAARGEPGGAEGGALAQQDKSAWTGADVIKYLGRGRPGPVWSQPGCAQLEVLADRALRSEFEPVACLEAPESVEVPRSLVRADGRSVYRRHGGVRFATHAQLSMEERMLALARSSAAPRMDRATRRGRSARTWRTSTSALAGGVQDVLGQRTRTGLRVDQAAAALSVLTDGRRISVIKRLPDPARRGC